MKVIYKTLFTSFVLAFLFACKKSEPEITPKFDYLSSSCQISSFTYRWASDMQLFPNYDMSGRLVELKQPAYPLAPRALYAFEYEGNMLKKIIKPVGDDPVPGSKYFVEVEYEYGPYGVEKIHQFINVSIYNRPDNRMEFERYEFEYNSPGKPTRMNYSVNFGTTEDKFVLGTITDFQYDTNGNLSREITQNPAGFGGSYETRTNQYFYDDKINNIRPLSYLFFNSASPSRVFSNNNLIGVNIDDPDKEIKYKLSYDSDNNVIDNASTFIKINWKCAK